MCLATLATCALLAALPLGPPPRRLISSAAPMSLPSSPATPRRASHRWTSTDAPSSPGAAYAGSRQQAAKATPTTSSPAERGPTQPRARPSAGPSSSSPAGRSPSMERPSSCVRRHDDQSVWPIVLRHRRGCVLAGGRQQLHPGRAILRPGAAHLAPGAVSQRVRHAGLRLNPRHHGAQSQHRGMVVDSANRYGVDPRLALAVSAHEGAMSACAGSFSGVQDRCN